MKWTLLLVTTLVVACKDQTPVTYGPAHSEHIASPDWTYDDADAGVRCYLFEGYGNGSGVQCVRIGAREAKDPIK